MFEDVSRQLGHVASRAKHFEETAIKAIEDRDVFISKTLGQYKKNIRTYHLLSTFQVLMIIGLLVALAK